MLYTSYLKTMSRLPTCMSQPATKREEPGASADSEQAARAAPPSGIPEEDWRAPLVTVRWRVLEHPGHLELWVWRGRYGELVSWRVEIWTPCAWSSEFVSILPGEEGLQPCSSGRRASRFRVAQGQPVNRALSGERPPC